MRESIDLTALTLPELQRLYDFWRVKTGDYNLVKWVNEIREELRRRSKSRNTP